MFVLSMLLDRADGELARQSGKRSAFGHKYDLVTDGLCNALTFIGLGIGLAGGSLGWRAIPMGVLAGVAVTAILFLTLRLEALRGECAAELGWIVGAGEVWLAMYLLGHPVDLAQALLLESLGQAVRAAAFAVPGLVAWQIAEGRHWWNRRVPGR